MMTFVQHQCRLPMWTHGGRDSQALVNTPTPVLVLPYDCDTEAGVWLEGGSLKLADHQMTMETLLSVNYRAVAFLPPACHRAISKNLPDGH